jgi:hypothetical protein
MRINNLINLDIFLLLIVFREDSEKIQVTDFSVTIFWLNLSKPGQTI